MSLVKKVTEFCAAENLIEENDSILIALSGGPDSVALACLLEKLRSKLKLSLAAVYVNHNLRPEAAEAEEQFCQSLCDDLNISMDLNAALPATLKLKVSQGAGGYAASCSGLSEVDCIELADANANIGTATYSTDSDDLNFFFWADFVNAGILTEDRNLMSVSGAAT